MKQPKIVTNCLLTQITVGTGAKSKVNKTITAQTNAVHGASKNSGYHVTKLFCGRPGAKNKDKPLHALGSIQSRVRSLIGSHSSFWDEKYKLMTYVNYKKIRPEIMQLGRDFEKEADRLYDRYDTIVAESKMSQNGTHDANLFPSAEQFRESLRFTGFKPMPVPHVGHFQIDMMNEDLEELQESLNARYEVATRESRLQILETLAKPLNYCIERLEDEDSAFQKTTITNISKAAALVADMNFEENSDLAELCRHIQISEPDAADIRNSTAIRKNVVAKQKKTLETLDLIFG